MANGNIGTLQRGSYQELTLERVYKDFDGKVPLAECMKLLEAMKREVIWLCAEYQVAVDKSPTHAFPGMTLWHLSIKRRDKEAIHDWRDLQEIKNQLCGPEFEAIEIYPAEDRKVDSANQYHLWAFMRDERRKRAPKIPVGWTQRYVTDDHLITGKQRPTEASEPKAGMLFCRRCETVKPPALPAQGGWQCPSCDESNPEAQGV